jgi:aryl-alcohol dehydrogenase-like predicted oxidoreductase
MGKLRKLGKNGPEITTVGFGAWAAGGPYIFGWGPQDDNDSIAAMRAYFDGGGNWIDTAAVYGFGHSETVVGRVLKDVSRETVIIATKCGRVRKEGEERPTSDLRPDSMRTQLEDSLRRLGTDYVDLFQIHWPDNDTGTSMEDSWATMARFQDEGKCRYIGVSNFNTEQMALCEKIRHVDSLQPPYSLLRRDVAADILPWCAQNGTGVIVYSPMQAGLLSGTFDLSRVATDDWRRSNPYFQEPNLTKNLSFVEELRPIAEKYDKSVGNLAVAWTLENPAVTAAIVGARRPSQVEENLQAMDFELSPDDLATINELASTL